MKNFDPDLLGYVKNMTHHEIKEVLSHNQPSQKTMEEFGQLKTELRGMKSGCIAHNQENTKMQINVATMNKDIEYIKKKLDDLVDSFQQFAEKATSLNGSKADKAELNLFEASTNTKLDELGKKLDTFEKWKIKVVIIFSIIATVGSFALHFLSQYFLNKIK